jgi:hypothetical protein
MFYVNPLKIGLCKYLSGNLRTPVQKVTICCFKLDWGIINVSYIS